MNRKKLVVLLLFLILIVGSFLALPPDLLTLENLQAQHSSLVDYKNNNFLLSVTLYLAVYIGTTALSLPGAAILTLAGGAIFGLVVGTILVSFASTIGATLAFLVSRYLLRDSIQKKFHAQLSRINSGIEREGAFYLFALRLVPAFPFFIINLVMGLTSMKTITFFLVSQIGMLPGTIAYVFAGTELSKINRLSDVISPGFLAAFVILGLLPIVSKKILDMLKARKIYKPFLRPTTYDYNLVVIGAGSGGLVSAYIAAAVKAKVALIERHQMGGDCLNTGCVPSKALIRSAKILHQAAHSQKYGVHSLSAQFDFAEIMERVQRIIEQIEPHDSVERYTDLGVECIKGEAKIIDPFRISVNGNTLTTRNIIVATGARPFVPPIQGLEDATYFTSDTIWSLRKLPKRLVVLGGGPIGCELAQCFQRFGSEVTIVEMAPSLLGKEDADAAKVIETQFTEEGIRVLTGHRAERFVKTDGTSQLQCSAGGKDLFIDYDVALFALGRRANVTGFGLEELGIEIRQNGTVEANELLQTKYPNIYVCGDVTGPFQFTHTAAHQAWFASVNALFSPFKTFRADYRVIPRVTFSDPEVASVGITENEASEQGIEYATTKYGIDDLDRAIADSAAHGFVKVLTPPGKDKILGVTIVGVHAGDLLAEFVLAMRYNLGLNKILGTIHAYPTLAEANKYAAGVWKRENKPEKVLELVKRFHNWRRAA